MHRKPSCVPPHACRGLHSLMPGFRARAKSPAETVCLSVCPTAWHCRRLYLQKVLEETDLITTQNIHNASISSTQGGRWAGRQKERSPVKCCGFIGAIKPVHTHTHKHTRHKHTRIHKNINICRHTHGHRQRFFWPRLRILRAVWCFSFNLPP